jgi:deoxyribodipyrimidine photo-lyase
MSRVLIYVLRRDLRLADNVVFHELSQSLQQAQKPYTHVLPLYVFSAQQIEVSGFLSPTHPISPYPEARSAVGRFWRCGPHRAKFVAECVFDLKSSLEKVGSGLAIRVGMVGQVVRDIMSDYKKDDAGGEVVSVWMTSEEGDEERREERDVKRAVEADGKEFRLWMDEKFLIDESVHLLALVAL